jgi:hypothetical protein
VGQNKPPLCPGELILDFNYIVVPAIVVLALVLVVCGALGRIVTLLRGAH